MLFSALAEPSYVLDDRYPRLGKTEDQCAMRIYAIYARGLAQVCRALRRVVTTIYWGSSRVVFDARTPKALNTCFKFVEDVSHLTVSSFRVFELAICWTNPPESGCPSLAVVVDRVKEEVRIRYDGDSICSHSRWQRLQDYGAYVKWTLLPAIAAKSPQKKSKILTKNDLRVLLIMASSAEIPNRISLCG